ncbi:hypothetical protein [Nocardioides salsibiostraticola]
MTTNRRAHLLGTTVVGLGLLLAACGSDPDATVPEGSATSESPTTTPTEPPAADIPAGSSTDPEAAYRSWLAALEAQDAEAACARNAPSFTIALRQEAILVKRARLGDPCVDFVALLWEDPDREYDPVAVEATQVTAERAILAVDFPGTDQTVTLTIPRGVGTSWYVATTEDRTAGTEDVSQRWVNAWCDLEPAMTTDQIVDLMGEPSGEYTVSNGGEPQLYWARREYDFRVYLDAQGTVLDLVGDYDELSAADRDLLPCPELR